MQLACSAQSFAQVIRDLAGSARMGRDRSCTARVFASCSHLGRSCDVRLLQDASQFSDAVPSLMASVCRRSDCGTVARVRAVGTLVVMARLLNDMPIEWADQLFLHPLNQEMFGTLVSLIGGLRQCREFADYYEFQQELLAKVWAAPATLEALSCRHD